MDPLQMPLQQAVLSFGRCNHLPLFERVSFGYDYLKRESTFKIFENAIPIVILK